MQSNLVLIDTTEFRYLCGIFSTISIFALIADMKLSLPGYIIVLLLLLIAKAKPVEELQDSLPAVDRAEAKDIVVLKKVYLRDSKKFQKRLYYFNRIGIFLILAGIITHDVLVNLKII